jgi:hypothetical protein
MQTAMAETLAAAPARYYPYENGKYEVKAGLYKLGQHVIHERIESRAFMIDRDYARYIAGKVAVHGTALYRHYLQAALAPALRVAVTRFMAARMAEEYPEAIQWDGDSAVLTNRWLGWSAQLDIESGAVAIIERGAGPLSHLVAEVTPLDAFDFLALNVPEDLAIWARNPETAEEWLPLMHICAPHHWDPREKVGRNFFAVHAPVAEAAAINAAATKMARAVIEQGPFIRFAWGMAANDVLNHHPEADHAGDRKQEGDEDEAAWAGMFVRVERQTLWGFPAEQGALFTIRPYWYPLAELKQEPERIRQLAAALRSMSPEAMDYKGMTRIRDRLAAYLDRLAAEA